MGPSEGLDLIEIPKFLYLGPDISADSDDGGGVASDEKIGLSRTGSKYSVWGIPHFHQALLRAVMSEVSIRKHKWRLLCFLALAFKTLGLHEKYAVSIQASTRIFSK